MKLKKPAMDKQEICKSYISLTSEAPPLGAAPPHPSGPSLLYCPLPEEALRGGTRRFPQLGEDPGGGGLAPTPPLPLPPPPGLRAAASDSRPWGSGSSQQPPLQPRRRHRPRGLAHSAVAAECPWTRISSQSSCFLGQPKPQGAHEAHHQSLCATEVSGAQVGVQQQSPALGILVGLSKETRQMEVPEFVAKVNDTHPRSFPWQ
ncbi:uncharacterized protein LOC123628231 [Lemur catta]|uniref:uncharacterized protein LOC123628231 n=1 Tax=Lemur catta TaxID=9447 RepID=UPI001E26C795|nr:uncharacterized protein LOC123628231 [Lemur catta]